MHGAYFSFDFVTFRIKILEDVDNFEHGKLLGV